jgi:trigger factor
MRLQAQGMNLEQYLQMTGQPQEQFVESLREMAGEAVLVDLALRSVALAEAIEATDEELDAEFADVAARIDETPERVRSEFERNGQVADVRSDLRKRKALDWLVEQVEIVDPDGKPIDRADLLVPLDTDDEVDADIDDLDTDDIDDTDTDESNDTTEGATDQ